MEEYIEEVDEEMEEIEEAEEPVKVDVTYIEPLDPTVERFKAAATLVVTAVINILNVYGYAVDAGPWLNLLGSVLAAASIFWSWWKNQNWTEEAVAGQELLNKLKRRARHAKAE